MGTGAIIGIIIAILLLILIALVLYVLFRTLLRPELHVRSNLFPTGVVTGVDPERDLRSFIMMDFERQTAANMVSIVRDMKFQISSIRCYRDILSSLIQEDQDTLQPEIMEQILELMYRAQTIDEQIQDRLNSMGQFTLDMANAEDIACVTCNYEALCNIGQEIEACIHSIFDIEVNRTTVAAYTMSIQLIMSEATRKLFVLVPIRDLGLPTDASHSQAASSMDR
ncbi:ECH_0282 family protein [Ehrlichia chaffeensis]